MKKWLFDPFVYIAGGKALLLGSLAMALTAVIGYFSHSHCDGAIDLHFGARSPLWVYFGEQLINWLSITVIFFLSGKYFSISSPRLIDVAGTVALARWPMIFSVIIGFGVQMTPPRGATVQELMAAITPLTVVCSLLSLVFVIWMIALLYNAFAISCNFKGSRGIGLFITSLLLAEILSKMLLQLLDKLI